MSFAVRETVAVTSATGGGATVFTGTVTGRLDSIRYVKDGAAPLASTSDFTITAEATGEAILTVTNINASTTWRPRVPLCSTSGVASLYAAAGEPVEEMISLANDRVKIVVAQGGNTKVGSFFVTLV